MSESSWLISAWNLEHDHKSGGAGGGSTNHDATQNTGVSFTKESAVLFFFFRDDGTHLNSSTLASCCGSICAVCVCVRGACSLERGRQDECEDGGMVQLARKSACKHQNSGRFIAEERDTLSGVSCRIKPRLRKSGAAFGKRGERACWASKTGLVLFTRGFPVA